NAIAKLRANPRALRTFPTYLSTLLVVVGVAWLFLLPLDDYSRHTYISENALLPGQVHTYFTGSEQHVYRAYRAELDRVKGVRFGEGPSAVVQTVLRESGLKVATQNYSYSCAGAQHAGQNVYGIVQAPRGDATEAIVLVAAWETIDEQLNLNGVALALTLARYFKRWSLWSKDIILLFPPDSRTGAQAWVDAYHDMHPPSVQPLPLKSGALQGAVAFEYAAAHPFSALHVVYDGVNGQLPNLDLVNIAVLIAHGQMGLPTALQGMLAHDDGYAARLRTMLRGMRGQALGHAAGAHSGFMPYHIDALTLQAVGRGWHDEMALGRTVESIARSLNNLLEHFHQSFFFYLLMQTDRFVSIGTYLPSAMLVAGNFTVMAIALWLRSGMVVREGVSVAEQVAKTDEKVTGKPVVPPAGDDGAAVLERHMALPLSVTAVLQSAGLVPLILISRLDRTHANMAFLLSCAASLALPLALGVLVRRTFRATLQELSLVKSFSCLLLGLYLSALATLNFSLSLGLGLLCLPLTYVGYGRVGAGAGTGTGTGTGSLRRLLSVGALCAVSPQAALLLASRLSGLSLQQMLTEAAFAWTVWHTWTQVAVWVVWWPAWMTCCFLVAAAP
ncbi:Glycosyl phosphatidyl inositol protein transamidase complex subunit, partial [Ascosphaera acerosa]